jgi:hypothetical protein
MLHIFSFSYAPLVYAEVEIKMDTTTIKGNTELPKIIYIVPWKKVKSVKSKEHQLVIHSLYGDLFDPVLPIIRK